MVVGRAPDGGGRRRSGQRENRRRERERDKPEQSKRSREREQRGGGTAVGRPVVAVRERGPEEVRERAGGRVRERESRGAVKMTGEGRVLVHNCELPTAFLSFPTGKSRRKSPAQNRGITDGPNSNTDGHQPVGNVEGIRSSTYRRLRPSVS